MYIIIDGNTLAHRVWHTPPISGGIQGEGWEDTLPLFMLSFCTQLTNIVERIDRYRPNFTKVVMVWDGKYSTKLRRELYPEYKHKRQTDRESNPEEFLPRELLDATRLALQEVCPRYGVYSDIAEGDDLIALLCEILEGQQVAIVTRDNDMYQLISQNVKVYDPFDMKLIGPEDVQEKYGVPPSKIPQYKALVGDKSDNYPGIKGIGPKKALGLIDSYSKIQYPEVDMFLKLATIPFEKLDTNSVLGQLATTDLDSPPEWWKVSEQFGFGERLASRLTIVV